MICSRLQKGFSLIELMIVLVVLVPVIILVIVAIDRWQDSKHVDQAAIQIDRYVKAVHQSLADNIDELAVGQQFTGINWLKSKSCGGSADNDYLPCGFRISAHNLDQKQLMLSIVHINPLEIVITTGSITNQSGDNSKAKATELIDALKSLKGDISHHHSGIATYSIEPLANKQAGIKMDLLFPTLQMGGSSDHTNWFSLSGDTTMKGNISFDDGVRDQNRQINNVSGLIMDNRDTTIISNKGDMSIQADHIVIGGDSAGLAVNNGITAKAEHQLTLSTGNGQYQMSESGIAAKADHVELNADKINLIASNAISLESASDVHLSAGKNIKLATKQLTSDKQIALSGNIQFQGQVQFNQHLDINDICLRDLQHCEFTEGKMSDSVLNYVLDHYQQYYFNKLGSINYSDFITSYHDGLFIAKANIANYLAKCDANNLVVQSKLEFHQGDSTAYHFSGLKIDILSKTLTLSANVESSDNAYLTHGDVIFFCYTGEK
ncbi:MAG: prepilin-type N-terminal cleavage/methylation domain-containing protein [Francisellaceae bacterium]